MGMVIAYGAIASLVFFIFGLLLGRRWRGAIRGGRPAFAKKKFVAGNGDTSRKDGPAEIYVGNLSLDMTREDVEREFGRYGTVQNVRLITRQGEKKAFGFVDMPVPREADAAIQALHGREIKGSALEVNIAKSPRSHRHSRRRR